MGDGLAVLGMLGVTGAMLPRLARTHHWVAVWTAALAVVLMLGAVRRVPALEATALGWLTWGRLEYALYGPLTILLPGLPALRASRLALQILAGVFALLVCWIASLAPFLGPLLYAPPRARMSRDDICLQGDGFSCGPAAAVTALRRAGLNAEFSALARAAHTSPVIGTPPDLLCQAMERLYPVTARRVYPRRLEELPEGQILLLIKHSAWTDHYLALFEYNLTQVVGADPLRGRVVLARREFELRWRHLAIVINRSEKSRAPDP